MLPQRSRGCVPSRPCAPPAGPPGNPALSLPGRWSTAWRPTASSPWGPVSLGAEGFAPVAIVWVFWAFSAALLTFPIQHWVIRQMALDGHSGGVRAAAGPGGLPGRGGGGGRGAGRSGGGAVPLRRWVVGMAGCVWPGWPLGAGFVGLVRGLLAGFGAIPRGRGGHRRGERHPAGGRRRACWRWAGTPASWRPPCVAGPLVALLWPRALRLDPVIGPRPSTGLVGAAGLSVLLAQVGAQRRPAPGGRPGRAGRRGHRPLRRPGALPRPLPGGPGADRAGHRAADPAESSRAGPGPPALPGGDHGGGDVGPGGGRLRRRLAAGAASDPGALRPGHGAFRPGGRGGGGGLRPRPRRPGPDRDADGRRGAPGTGAVLGDGSRGRGIALAAAGGLDPAARVVPLSTSPKPWQWGRRRRAWRRPAAVA